ncbi:MAG: hypothetical protein SFX73_14220 [Kofleriaceae bacterium]|nr:hypothetical protein [Kofleriaceae bacterium]
MHRVAIACALVMAVAAPARANTAYIPPCAEEPETKTCMVKVEPPPCDPAVEIAGTPICPYFDTAPQSVRVVSRPLALAAGIVPGIVARGLGSYLRGNRVAAKRLALAGGAGLGLMLAGGLPLGISRGNAWTIEPFAPMLITGAGLFFGTWVFDLWGTAGGRRTLPEPRAITPWSLEIGAIGHADPYRTRLLGTAHARVVLDGRFEIGAGGWFDAGGDGQQLNLEANVRLLGAAPTGAVIADGSRLWIRTTARRRAEAVDAVDIWTGEISVAGRYDMVRLAPSLDGAFFEVSTGIGLERVTYATDAVDHGSLLLGGFAWGFYLRDRGELTAFYEHRRDQLAGGIWAGRAAGFIGSVGGTLDLRVVGPWAVRGEIEFGSAWVGSLALRYQGGAR